MVQEAVPVKRKENQFKNLPFGWSKKNKKEKKREEINLKSIFTKKKDVLYILCLKKFK